LCLQGQGLSPVKRGGGKASWINREQSVVHWSRKRHPKLLPKQEAAVPIKPPICCVDLSHQKGLPLKTFSTLLRGFGFVLCFAVTTPQIMQRWTYRGAKKPLVHL